jgi:dTDP-glucose 4,6-dehydratase
MISKIMGHDVVVELEEARMRPKKSEVDRLWADNTKAKSMLGWKPSFAGRKGFERGLIETASWFSDKKNLVKYKSGIYNI